MIKQLGWISVAALSLAALSACDGQPKPAPTEAKAATESTAEVIQVDPVAEHRLKTMYGNDLGAVLGGSLYQTPQEAPGATVAAPAVDENALKAAAHKSGQVFQAPVVQSKTLAIGSAK